MKSDRVLYHLSFALGALAPFMGANLEFFIGVGTKGLSPVHALVIAAGGAALIGAPLLGIALLGSIVAVRPTHPALRFACGVALFFACFGALQLWTSIRSTGVVG
jgi:hypothetical protein